MTAIDVAADAGPSTASARDARAPLHRPMPSGGWRGWLGPLGVTAVAGVIRFVSLGRPHDVIFDETHYVKAALALLRFGFEMETGAEVDDRILESGGRWQDLDIFTGDPAFVVHPPVGKWVIASGELMFGLTPFGWRFGPALLGTLTVLLTCRVVRRLTRSNLIGCVAGLLLALDGLHIVLSRSALLDISLTFFVVAALGCLLRDRDWVRERLDHDVGASPPRVRLGLRPWRVAGGVMLGLACGVKWSGLWFMAAFILLAMAWDVGARRGIGSARPRRETIRRDLIPAGLSLVAVPVVVYLLTWSGWFLSDTAYDRAWAASHPGPWYLPDALRSLMEYHRAAWRFHVNLSTEHSYQSSAWAWLFQARPTSFSYDSEGLSCGSAKCSAAVLALGNPVIWWAGLLALGHNSWRAVAGRDWRSATLIVGYLAGWVPWLIYHDRTIFSFYAVVMAPFLCGMLAISLASLAGGPDGARNRRQAGILAAGAVLLLVVVAAWFFMPIWVGQTLTYEAWLQRMWLPTWI